MKTLYKAELKKALINRVNAEMKKNGVNGDGDYFVFDLHNDLKNKCCRGKIYNRDTCEGVWVCTMFLGKYTAAYTEREDGFKTASVEHGEFHSELFETLEPLVDYICDAIAPAPVDVAERTTPPDERLARDYEPDENEAGFMDDPTYDG